MDKQTTKEKRVKAIELVMDWNLWPRHIANSNVDRTHINKMKEAMKIGVTFPPVIVNEADYKIVDGFHRTQAYIEQFGDMYEIPVEFRKYNEKELFIEAAKINNTHGLPLSPSDRVHVILKARRMKIPWATVCEALGMNSEHAKDFIHKRTAKTSSGEFVPLKGGARNLAGKVLTKEQESFIKNVSGSSAQSYATLLLGALNNDAIVFTDKVVTSLRKLLVRIEDVLKGIEYEG